MRLFWIYLGAASGVWGCNPVMDAQTIPLGTKVQALYSGGYYFCAKNAQSLSCWSTSETWPYTEPQMTIPNLPDIKAVGIAYQLVCVLREGEVDCFVQGGDDKFTQWRPPLEKPFELVGFGDFKNLVCALDLKGLACWDKKDGPIYREPGFDQASRMMVSTNSDGMCVLQKGKLFCFDCSPTDGALRSTIVMKNVEDPKAVYLGPGGSTIALVDGTSLRASQVPRINVVGNPFAVKNPLDVEFTVKPVTQTTVDPPTTNDLGKVRQLANQSIWPLVLTDQGVFRLNLSDYQLRPERLSDAKVPDQLWSSSHDEFLTQDENGVYLHEPKRIRKIDGLKHILSVCVEVWWTCLLDETGTVGCIPNPKD